MKLLVATGNPHKLKELQELLSDLPYELVCLADLGGGEDVEETGVTFRENAELKALGYAKQFNLLTLAEDSGLSCDALDGAPGVYSARFAGEQKDDHENNLKVLRLMDGLPDNCRSAHFTSAISVATPDGVVGTVEGEVHGYVGKEMKGDLGFGYDSLFFYPDFGKHFGEVPSEKKHEVSHRAKSLKKAKELLADYIGS